MRLELIVRENTRTQNLPTVNEIAAIIPSEYHDDTGYKDARNHSNSVRFSSVQDWPNFVSCRLL